MNKLSCLINGAASDHIHVADRGLQYGDGVFETIAIKNHQLLNFPAHLHRLQTGCDTLHIDFQDNELLQTEARQLATTISKGILKIIITRGSAGRGYEISKDNEPSRIISLHAWPDFSDNYQQQGIALALSPIPLSRNPTLAGIKHSNRLEQVLASQSLQQTPEALMLDTENQVIGGIKSNCFIRQQHQWLTPDLTLAGVEGTIRKAILTRLDCSISQLTQTDVEQADEVFLCNSIIGIWPIKQFHDTMFDVGTITLSLIERLKKDLIIA